MKGNLKEFVEGQLCYVVLRRYQGKGKPTLILHEAQALAKGSFGYGFGKHWVIKPGTLMGIMRSDRKAAASRANGKKGGRPRHEK